MANALRIALIADIHHGMDQGTKLGSAALDLLRPFVDWVNATGPDLVVELGDRTTISIKTRISSGPVTSPTPSRPCNAPVCISWAIMTPINSRAWSQRT